MPYQRLGDTRIHNSPNASGPIPACGDQRFAVRAELDRVHLSQMTFQIRKLCARLGAPPEDHRSVFAGGDPLSIGAYSDAGTLTILHKTLTVLEATGAINAF